MRLTYPCASVEIFVRDYCGDISSAGMFVEGVFLDPGFDLQLEVCLRDGTPILRGAVCVLWRRSTAAVSSRPPGVGLQFVSLDEASARLVARAAAMGTSKSRYDDHAGGDVRDDEPGKQATTALPSPITTPNGKAKLAKPHVSGSLQEARERHLRLIEKHRKSGDPTHSARSNAYDRPPASMKRLEQPKPPAVITTRATTNRSIFISYKREDLSRIAPHLRRLQTLGQEYWYDADTVAGTRWPAVIEERLRGCTMLIVFLTRASIKSKWVEREVAIADEEGKTIIAVQIEPVTLRGTLRLVLANSQMLDASHPNFESQFQRALAPT